MAVKLKSLRADVKKETEGDWEDLPDVPGVRVRVRSTNYQPFVVARDAASRRLAREYGKKTVPESELAQINGELAVKHLLLEWEGFDEPFSADVAQEVLSDPAYRDLRYGVFEAAHRVGQAKIEFVKDAEGNSAGSSAIS